MIYESVINISQGQEPHLIAAIADSLDEILLDVHSDHDHHRSVFTLGSYDLIQLETAVKTLTAKCYKLLNFSSHQGEHPRLGLIDVVPFVSYDDIHTAPTKETIEVAKNFGQWVYDNYEANIFFYDFASEQNFSLPYLRKNAYKIIPPSIGKNSPNVIHGSMCISARKPLVAININIESDDLQLAKQISANIRESSGGIKGVRAIGLSLDSRGYVQVSMNIVDTLDVNIEEICLEIKKTISSYSYNSNVELVGLVPEHQYSQWSEEFISWSEIDSSFTIENRLSKFK